MGLFTAHLNAAPSFKFPKLDYVTGGVLRYPYSLQPGDKGNIYFESFVEVALPVWKTKKAKISIFARGFYSLDSHALSFNNRSKISIGVSYNRNLHKTFSVRATLKYDHDYRPLSGATKNGVRANLSYYYYKSR